MTLILTLFIAVISASNIAISQPCQRLFMQGLDNTQLLPYAELSGLYTITDRILNGFPVYRHEEHQDQYFLYNSTLRVLVLGPWLLMARTSGRQPSTNVQYPYNNVITGWRVYQPATERSLIRVFCFFSVIHHRYKLLTT